MSGYKRVNFYELCRLCSSNQQKEKTHIFHEEGQKKHLQAKIQLLFSLKICEDDFLPKVICSKCLESLEDCYTFRNDCISSESMLSSYFNNFRYTEDFTKSGKVYIKDTTPPKAEPIITTIAPSNVITSINSKSDVQEVNPIYVQYAENKTKIDTKNVPVTYNVMKQSKLNDINNFMINSNGEIVNITYDFDSILNQSNTLNKQAKIDRPAKKKIKIEHQPLETIVIDDYEKLPHIKRSNVNKIVYPVKSSAPLQNLQQHILTSSNSIASTHSLINNSAQNTTIIHNGISNSRQSNSRVSNSHANPIISNSIITNGDVHSAIIIPNTSSLITPSSSHTNAILSTNSNVNSLHPNTNSVVIPNSNSMITQHANSTIISNAMHSNQNSNTILTNSNVNSANSHLNSIHTNPSVLTNSNIFTNSILSNSNVITSANSVLTNGHSLRNITVPLSNVNSNVVTSQSYVASAFNPQKLLESINNAQKIVDSIGSSAVSSGNVENQQNCFFTNMDGYEIPNTQNCTQNKMAQTDEVLNTIPQEWVETITPSPPKPNVKVEPGTPKLFACELCKKTFKRREHMYQHVKLHTGFRPFTCENCNKSFMRKEHLLRHQTSHTGLKNFICNVCDKSFSRNDNLLKHKKTHDKESHFSCEICQKQFVMKHYYVAHKVTHENDTKCHTNVWNTVKTHS